MKTIKMKLNKVWRRIIFTAYNNIQIASFDNSNEQEGEGMYDHVEDEGQYEGGEGEDGMLEREDSSDDALSPDGEYARAAGGVAPRFEEPEGPGVPPRDVRSTSVSCLRSCVWRLILWNEDGQTRY